MPITIHAAQDFRDGKARRDSSGERRAYSSRRQREKATFIETLFAEPFVGRSVSG